MRKRLKVLVVGGGIGGLAAALALSRKGHEIHVLEQAPQFAEIGAGIQLGPNVFRMFDYLGITNKVLEFAVLPDALIMMDCVTAQEVTRVPLGKEFLKRFGHPYAVIHRADLHRILHGLCETSAGVRLETSTKIAGYEDLRSGVRLRTEDGRLITGDALIGADGLWSTIRGGVINDGRPTVSGHIAYRAVLPKSEMPERLRWQAMTVWAGERTHLVHYPLRGGELFNLVAVFHSDKFSEGWDTYGDADELHARFSGTCDEVRTLLAKIESWRMWVLCDRPPAKDWSRGRVTLLGDAAHPMLQYLAQGANMAIEDAVCLAEAIERADGDVSAAFQAYPAERYLRTGRVQIMARVYGEVFHASGVARELRNNMLKARTPRESYDAMEWLYRVPDPTAWRNGMIQPGGSG